MIRLMLYLFAFIVTACGKTTGQNDETFPQKFALKTTGYYRAPFATLNIRKGRVSGRASFFINEFQFYAKVSLRTPWKEVHHLQMVHEKSVCPTMKDDINHDGFLDAVEAVAVAGNILIPLDNDINSQLGKFTVGPVSGANGKYLYGHSASSRIVMQDLRSRDPYPLDFIGKLKNDEEIDFNKRVVLIYSVPETLKLPSTIETIADLSNHASLPIACANILETAEIFP